MKSRQTAPRKVSIKSRNVLMPAKAVQYFFTTLLLGYGFGIVLMALLPSYLSFPFSQTLSVFVNDGWCKSQLQGIGAHCFGDFYYPLNFANQNLPWSDRPNPNPPLGVAIFKPFASFVSHDATTRIPLFIYLLLCLVAIVIPAIHLYLSKRLNAFSSISIGIISLVFAPVLMSLDRGNAQLLLIPFVYFFSLAVMEGRDKEIIYFGVLLVLFKPQMILLGAIFLVSANWKSLIKFASYSTFLFIASFLLYPSSFFTNIHAYERQVSSYQNYAVPGALSPVNLSLANLWSWSKGHLFVSNGSTPGFFSTGISLIILLIVAINMVLVGKFRSRVENLALVLCLPILIPSTSFAYYLCTLLPVIILICGEKFSQMESEMSRSGPFLRTEGITILAIFQRRSVAFMMTVTSFLLFIPWAIPWSIFGRFSGKPWSTIGINWLFGQFALAGFFVALFLAGTVRWSSSR